MDIDVVVRGDHEAARLVARLARNLGDGRPALLGLIDRIMGFQRDRFAGRGQRWRRLAAKTIREHRLRGRGAEPLLLTGALMRSLSQRGAPGQFIEITAEQLRFGTRIYYARFHKLGRGVPKRPPAGLTRAQRVEIVDQFRALLLS